MEPPMLIGATISPTSAAFSVTMPSNGERMKDSSRWLSRTFTRAAAVRWRASAKATATRATATCDSETTIRCSASNLRCCVQAIFACAPTLRAAVVHLAGRDGVARQEIHADFQTPPGVGQENLVLLVLGVECSQRRFCRSKLGFA